MANVETVPILVTNVVHQLFYVQHVLLDIYILMI